MANDLYIAATPFHLLYSCARADLGDFIVVVNGFKFSNELKEIVDYKFKNRHITVENFYYYRRNIRNLLRFRKNMRTFYGSINNCIIGNIYAFNDVDPVSQWIMANIKHNGKCYVIEEGIGLYRDTNKRHEQLFKYGGKILFGSTFQNVSRIGECKYTNVIICRESHKLSTIQKSKDVMRMEKVDFTHLANELKIRRLYKKAWFIGQPLVEDGVISLEEYIGFIWQLVDKDALKGALMIKPHPREGVDKYKRLVEELDISICPSNEIPVELLIDNSRETNVYTLYSSAVRNLCNTQNISVEVLYKLLPGITGITDDLFEAEGICIRSKW